MNYEYHQYANLFPMMSDDEFKALSEAIVNLGFDKAQPIILFEGKILDGRNRYKACQYTGTTPLFNTFEGTKEEALQYVITRNLNRRSLTSEQRAAIAVDAEDLFSAFREQSKEKQLSTLKQNQKSESTVPQKIGERGNTEPEPDTEPKHQKETQSKIAKVYNTNRESVRKQQKVKQYAPELHEKVKKGEVKQQEAYKVAQKIEKEEKQIQKETSVATKVQSNETYTDEKGRVLHIVYSDNKQNKFNETNESIDWAWWSWNPITGCNHGCSYCYARDIANSARMNSIYPFGFEPTFLPHRLTAPKKTKPLTPQMIRTKAKQRNLPLEYAEQFAKNVFVCSMADLFGDWIPTDWIKQVFEQVTTNTQWNYLFLTKFPQRLKAIQDDVLGGKFPDNCWVGTTVDEQKRVKTAQKAFEGINAKVKWLSLEPLLTNLEFDNLGMFDMVAIGGQSSNSQCEAKQPQWEWVEHIIYQSHLSGTIVYFKENLTVRPKKFPIK